MTQALFPVHPDLTPERLSALAAVIALAHDSSVHDARSDLGETPWSIATRGYERMAHQLRVMIESGEYTWLGRVPTRSLRFAFRLGMVPVRICRERPGKPPPRVVSETEAERSQQLNLFSQDRRFSPDVHYRIFYTRDEQLRISGVWIVALNDAREILYRQTIIWIATGQPLGQRPGDVADNELTGPQSIELPEPEVDIRGDDDEEDTGTQGETGKSEV